MDANSRQENHLGEGNKEIYTSEIWKTIPDFPDYEISNYGQIRSWKPYRNFAPKPTKPRLCKFNLDKDGYAKVVLYHNRVKKEFRLHRLVLKVFLNDSNLLALHKDGNIANNHLTNLYWGTAKQNSLDIDKHGTRVRGTKVNTCKLTEDQVLYVRSSKRKGKELARKFNCSIFNIYAIRSRKTWKHLKSK